MAHVDAIFLDMDGTILRLEISTAAMNATREKLRQLFLKHGIDKTFRPVLATIRISLQALTERGTPADTIGRQAYQILDELEEDGAAHASICTGAEKVLMDWHGSGRQMSLISNNGRAAIKRALTTSGLSPNMFASVVSRDDVICEKPHPEPVLKTLRQLELLTEGASIVMIGDSINDMRSARAAVAAAPVPMSIATIAVGEQIHQDLGTEAGLVDRYAAGWMDLPQILDDLEA